MRLSKAEREQVRMKFGGRCAYCGEPLGDRWHADHFEPVERIIEYVSGKGAVQTGECYRPERHRLDNMNPACPPCNIDKHSLSLENWRQMIQKSNEVLMRDVSTFRRAVRFRLLEIRPEPVTFYFERVKPNGGEACPSGDSIGRHHPGLPNPVSQHPQPADVVDDGVDAVAV